VYQPALLEELGNNAHTGIRKAKSALLYSMSNKTLNINDRLISKRELAERLTLSIRTVSNLTKSGQIPFVKIGSRILFDWKNVRKALTAHEVTTEAKN